VTDKEGGIRRWWQAGIEKLHLIFDLESSGRVTVYSVLVGIVAGLGGAAFYWLLVKFQDLALGRVVGYYPPPAGTEGALHTPHLPELWWAVLLVPTVGGLLCGLIVYTWAPEAEGHGTDGMIRAFHRQQGKIRGRVPIIKSIASILTIGTGGSAGREGPIAQIGAGFGSVLASRLRLSEWERRMLVLAGAAGGISAIFRAPLGGALFAVEVLYSSTAIEFSAIVPSVVSAVVAYSVFSGIFGKGFAFLTPPSASFAGPVELPFYLVFAVVCALVGFFYVRCFYGLRDWLFKRLPIPDHFKPALGGLALGIIAVGFPQVMAGGYGWIQRAFDRQLSLELMALLVVAKILATSFCISSGGSGGVFAPSLFIGAMLGGAFGTLCHLVFPTIAPQPEAFVLVGMGGFFAGVAKVPLTALIMVCEMTGSYNLLVPLMVVNVVAVAILSSRWSLYEEQVPSLIDSPAHLGEFVVDVLENIRVRQIYNLHERPMLVREDMPLPKILHLVANSSASVFPVVDRSERLVGLLLLHDLRAALLGNGAGNLIVAADIARTPPVKVTPDDNLHEVLRLYAQRQIDEIPVVSPEAPDRVLCMLRRGEVIAAYDRQIAELRAQHQSAA